MDIKQFLLIKISIHAPTRGATMGYLFFARLYLISIHAPTRGATLNLDTTLILYEISIHAPTRGATFLYDLPVDSQYFNPRPYKRSDYL